MLYKSGETENPKDYNQKIAEFRGNAIAEGFSCGCVSTRACEGCKSLITDSICLCIPSFICPECGFDNGEEYREIMSKFKFIPSDNTFNLSGDSLPLLPFPPSTNITLTLRGQTNGE